jgi:hypothetical protein
MTLAPDLPQPLAPLPEEALRVLGRYRLGRRIASGSAGTVFEATDERSARTVVAKVFDAQEQSLRPWVDEMRLALRLVHPNIVRCLDGGLDDSTGLWTLIFERAQGGSLRRALQERRHISPEELWRLLVDVAAALEHAHALGVVHRDIKPENIVQAESRTSPWMLTDFGIGRHLERGAHKPTQGGSLEYLAPEAMDGSSGLSADQFSLGLMGAECHLGARVDREGRANLVLEGRRAQAGSKALARVLARLCETVPHNRFPSMALAARVLRERSRSPLLQRRTRDGVACLLGDEAWLYPKHGEAPVRHRVPGALGLVHLEGSDVAVAATPRRLVQLTAQGTQTLFAADVPFVTVLAQAPECWLLERGCLTLQRGGTEACRSDGFDGALELSLVEGAPALACEREGTLLVTATGSRRAVLATRSGAVVRWRTHLLPQPAQALTLHGNTPLLVCGDARGGGLFSLVGGALVQHSTFPTSPDTVWLDPRSTSPRPQLLPAAPFA